MLQRLAFPVVFGGGSLLIYFAIATGIDRGLVLVAAPVIAGAIVMLLERAIPYEPSWSRGDVRTDVAHLVVSSLMVPALYEASVALGLQSCGAFISRALGIPLWPSAWPLWAQGVLALGIGELGYYWAHRLGHSHLWRFHATHHSSQRLYWLNVVRFHPVDALLQLSGQLALLGLLGASADAVAIVIAASNVHGMLQHSNADLRLGPLDWIFSAAPAHRWHHVPDARSQHNFGQVLLVFDILFGTRFVPRERPPPDVGLDVAYPQRYLAQLAAPFRRERS